jgi:micrococcal nuclease
VTGDHEPFIYPLLSINRSPLLPCSLLHRLGEEGDGKVQGARATIQNGGVVEFFKVVDGDSVLVTQEGRGPASVRILGIKSFDAKIKKGVVIPTVRLPYRHSNGYSQRDPMRVLLNANSKDRYGR